MMRWMDMASEEQWSDRGPEMSGGNAVRFEEVGRALEFVNGQLQLKGYLGQGERVVLGSGKDDDDKLVINTIHRLLKELDAKNEKLKLLEVEKRRSDEKLGKLKLTTVQNSDLVETRPPVVPEPQVHRRLLKLQQLRREDEQRHKNAILSLEKNSRIQLNKLESTINELRNAAFTEQLRSKSLVDLTWEPTEEDTQGSDNRNGLQEYIETSDILEKHKNLLQLRVAIIEFLAMVNKITYSKNILNLNEIVLDFDPKKVQNDKELEELVNDYFQIIQLSSANQTDDEK